MIHPSELVGIKNRMTVEFAVKILNIRVDTFVYLCRDLNIEVSNIKFLIKYYYKLDEKEAKWIAFSSSAWGDKAAEMVKLNEQGFDYLVELSKEQKK
jgi:hypothetical protein